MNSDNNSDNEISLGPDKPEDKSKLDALYADVYGELRKLAQSQMKRAWSMGTISTTALVNEAYLKLVNINPEQMEDRSHFFAIAATAMRQILINYAEQKSAKKRGGDWQKVTYEEKDLSASVDVKTLLAVNDALEEIRQIDETLVQLVELRFFAGLTEAEISEVYGVNERTVRRRWKQAKLLLSHALQNET